MGYRGLPTTGTIATASHSMAGRERLLLLDAFVYRVEGAPPALRCGPEVESAFWIPVAELWSLNNLDHHTLDDGSETLVYPAIGTSQGIIFGIIHFYGKPILNHKPPIAAYSKRFLI